MKMKISFLQNCFCTYRENFQKVYFFLSREVSMVGYVGDSVENALNNSLLFIGSEAFSDPIPAAGPTRAGTHL
jgi:hypothetical protein